ncbi:thioredoxin family protein [Corynebacterium sp. AOP40-9SA-29]|uniref:thioredoxin family protein n=1 Tax=Corynebacterium sp. AOP40-9SA-29 TaxID=3457677 RepID=UPI0040333A5D
MADPVTVTQDTFRSTVIESDVPVLVDFWAGWCQPCIQMEPALNNIADKYGDSVTVAKVNVEEERGLAAMFQVMSIPALFIYHEGRKVVELHGRQSEADLSDALDALVSA